MILSSTGRTAPPVAALPGAEATAAAVVTAELQADGFTSTVGQHEVWTLCTHLRSQTSNKSSKRGTS